ncbi:MAG: response regulator [SAR324 cluster bacterium]|nr:response regulator [SAR324 cluster bacterium]
MQNTQVRFKDSIAVKLLTAVFAFYLVLTFTVTIIHMVTNYYYEEQALMTELDNIALRHIPVVQQDLLTQKNSLQKELQGIHAFSGILGVRILSTDGSVRAQIGKTSPATQGNSINGYFRLEDAGFFSKKYEIRSPGDAGVKMGEIELFSSLMVVYERLKIGFLLIIINAVIKTIGLWLIFLWISRHILSIPLGTLIRAMDHVKLENLDQQRVQLPLDGKNEITLLGRSMNEMMEKLSRAIASQQHTELQKLQLEQQLKQAQKMEAIGTLAGGIAHDFNNLLYVILGYANMSKDDLPADHPVRENLGEIVTAGHRAEKLIQQILTFSRQAEQEKIPLHLVPLVKESLKFLRASLPTTIHIVSDINPDQKQNILADPTQMHQILLNLCTNASYAMKDEGGTLKVMLDAVFLTLEEALPLNLVEGHYVRLRVQDTGTGIEPDILDRIFEPYFTTKPVGEGTGMGLAVVHGIIQAHKGAITVTSTGNEGTLFTILLPVFESEDIETYIQKIEPVSGQNQHILLVDDEELVLQMEKEQLERLGYQVTAFTDPLTAYDAFLMAPFAFDLLLTDQTMPSLTGKALAGKILGKRPDLPVILVSGYHESLNLQELHEAGIMEFLTKPVNMRQLSHILQTLLEK